MSKIYVNLVFRRYLLFYLFTCDATLIWYYAAQSVIFGSDDYQKPTICGLVFRRSVSVQMFQFLLGYFLALFLSYRIYHWFLMIFYSIWHYDLCFRISAHCTLYVQYLCNFARFCIITAAAIWPLAGWFFSEREILFGPKCTDFFFVRWGWNN